MALEEQAQPGSFAAVPESSRFAVDTILSFFALPVENARFRPAELSTGLGASPPPVGNSGWLV